LQLRRGAHQEFVRGYELEETQLEQPLDGRPVAPRGLGKPWGTVEGHLGATLVSKDIAIANEVIELLDQLPALCLGQRIPEGGENLCSKPTVAVDAGSCGMLKVGVQGRTHSLGGGWIRGS
jgi:hypothetical protein